MKFENEELQLSFEVPEPLTVRDVLRYDSMIDVLAGGEFYERLWSGVRVLAKDWQCPTVKLDDDLGTLTDFRAIDAIKYAGLAVFSYVWQAKQVPKN